jgi:hypothetical protein
MRALLTLLFIALATLAGAQEVRSSSRALILINSHNVGTIAAASNYYHGPWIQWPPANGNGENRLLSLTTGVDWLGEADDFTFRPLQPPSKWIAENYAAIRARGHFDAQRDYLGRSKLIAIWGQDGQVHRAILGLCLQPGTDNVEVFDPNGPLPTGGVLVFEARDWNDVAAISKKVGGPTMVIEFPPAPGSRLTHAWFYGRWQAGLPTMADVGVPGLIPARRALELLIRPADAKWEAEDLGPYGDARRWLEHVRFSGPTAIGIVAFLGAYIIGCAVYYILKEERAPIACWMLRAFYLCPSALVLGGQLTHWLGIANWMFAMAAAIALTLIWWGVVVVLTRRFAPSAHPLWRDSMAGLVLMAATPPSWSFLNPVLFGGVRPLSGEAAGALLMYLTGALCLGEASALARWASRVLCVALVAWGVALNPWWVSGEPGMVLLPLVALLACEGKLGWPAIAALAVVADPTFRAIRHGLTYAPGGLLPTYGAREALNVAQHLAFVISIPLVLFVGSVAMLGSAGDRFLFHKMRRAWLVDGRPKAYVRVAVACMAMGVLEPIYLQVGLLVAMGALVIAVFDAAQPL